MDHDSHSPSAVLLTVFARARPFVVALGLLAALALVGTLLPAAVVSVVGLVVAGALAVTLAGSVPLAIVWLVTAGIDADLSGSAAASRAGPDAAP
jgi:hypothetical protein